MNRINNRQDKGITLIALVVTIVVLIILAGITLNAVIGENGIILQAKDTKNLITNETTYDNAQLAQLQNELKDNGLYSGIGIIPGTDTGGGSEGGENGIGGGGNNQGGQTNQGGNTNTGTGDNTNTGSGGSDTNTSANTKPIDKNSLNLDPGGGALVGGKTDEDPFFYVVSGEEIAASFYQSDVTIQIFTNDRTKKIKYILTTTVTEISNELYPSGLVRELDIENGGTLTFTKDGEYTITAYAYDSAGNKSNPTIMWLKRQVGGSTTGGITLTVASGNEGANKWYTSNVTLRVLGTDTGSKKVKYRIQGTASGTGQLGDIMVESPGVVDTNEVDITNGTTFRIVADGTYTITAYSYDAAGVRISSSEVLNLKKDSTRPTVKAYTGEQIPGSGFKVTISAEDKGAGLTSNAYTYRHRLAETNGEYTSEVSASNTKTYTGLNQQKTYDMYVVVTDQAGNMAISDVISRPSLWVSSGTAGETKAEGGRNYYRSNISLTFRGQDSNNVDITKTTYQIIGTVTEAEANGGVGSMDGTSTPNGTVLTANEVELPNDKTTKTISLQANGNWTVKVKNYNKEGKLVTTNVYEVTRDTIVPVITSFTASSTGETTANASVSANDPTSGLATKNDAYTYYVGTTSKASQTSANFSYSGLTKTTNYTTLKVIAKDKAGNTSEKTPTSVTYHIVDRVSTGDYVAYNAGTWPSGSRSGSGWTAQPGTYVGTNAAFSGYTAGRDKGTNAVATFNGDTSNNIAKLQGWRVLNKSGSGSRGTVTLVHAGVPCNAYHNDSTGSTFVTALHNFCRDNFVNSTYASSASSVSSTEPLISAGMVATGTAGGSGTSAFYWLGTYGDNSVYYVSGVGSISYGYNIALGVRPLVTLKAGVKTNYAKDTSYLGQTCWAVK